MVPAQTVNTVVEGSAETGKFSGVPTDFLGSKGVFAALIVAIITVELYRFLVKKNLVIHLPEGVPAMVS